MRWVNDTLPPRARLRWLLVTVRLSHRSLTGMLRTEVAVGTLSEVSMFFAVAAAMPRSTVCCGSSVGWETAVGFGSRGSGLAVLFAGSAALLTGRGLATGAGEAAVFAGSAGAAAFGFAGEAGDRKSGGEGKRGAVRVDLGGRPNNKKKKK